MTDPANDAPNRSPQKEHRVAADGSVESEQFEQLFRATRADVLAYLARRAETAEAGDMLAEVYLVPGGVVATYRSAVSGCGCSGPPAGCCLSTTASRQCSTTCTRS